MNNIVTLIFSKDRALQVRAAIESLYLHCKDANEMDVSVLYVATDEVHEKQYQKLIKMFPSISFHEQIDFIDYVVTLLKEYKYVLFVVDDTFFVKDFRIGTVTKSLADNIDCIGFSLRLGKNTTYCYMGNYGQEFPSDYHQMDETLKYEWAKADGDFGYPLEVSSSAYRVKDVLPIIQQSHRHWKISHPGHLEGNMSKMRKHLRCYPYLLCYEQSVAFANPLNIVRPEKRNRFSGVIEYDVITLAEQFDKGCRIDVKKYSDFVPKGAHEDVDVVFVKEIE